MTFAGARRRPLTAMAGSRRRSLWTRLRHPQTTVRWRLTLLYGGLFLVSGAVLLAVTYTLVAHDTVGGPRIAGPDFLRAPGLRVDQVVTVPPGGNVRRLSPAMARRITHLLGTEPGQVAARIVGSGQRIADLHQLVIESAIALALMAIISGVLGWVVAGRALRPLRTMTATTREISAVSLHRRLAMTGAPDELHELADTVDALLERLQGAFDAQRRFVANASHELRTPLTAARALLEMALSDPHPTLAGFRIVCGQVLEEGEHQEQLIDALLTLAHGQRAVDDPRPGDLAAIVCAVLPAHEAAAAGRGLALDVSLAPAPLEGDDRLIERLASNLIDNAIRHNVASGHLRVAVDTSGRSATLWVANSGPVVAAGEIGRLLAPFQRLDGDRAAQGDGLGLGLSIVTAIADAHGAALSVAPRAGGGLEVEVRFPATDDPARASGDTLVAVRAGGAGPPVRGFPGSSLPG